MWTEFQNILLKEKSMVEFHLCVYTYTHICICIPNWLSVQKISRRITKKSLIAFSVGDWERYHYLYFSPSILLSSWNVLPGACVTLLFKRKKMINFFKKKTFFSAISTSFLLVAFPSYEPFILRLHELVFTFSHPIHFLSPLQPHFYPLHFTETALAKVSNYLSVHIPSGYY